MLNDKGKEKSIKVTEKEPSQVINLEEAKKLLLSGPICIGENHSKKDTRESLIQLIESGSVKKLFLEIPNCSREVQEWLANPENIDINKAPSAVRKYLNSMSTATQKGDNSNIRWADLIIHAKKYGVAVYCDDLPIVDYYVDNNILDGEPIVDPLPYFSELLKITNKHVTKNNTLSILQTQKSEDEGVKIRNNYSKKLISSCTGGLLNMTGVVIFGGANHFNQQYGENSLQILCNISEDRVIGVTENTKKNQSKANYSQSLNTSRKSNISSEPENSMLHDIAADNVLHALIRQSASGEILDHDVYALMKAIAEEYGQEKFENMMLREENSDGLTPAKLAAKFNNISVMVDCFQMIREEYAAQKESQSLSLNIYERIKSDNVLHIFVKENLKESNFESMRKALGKIYRKHKENIQGLIDILQTPNATGFTPMQLALQSENENLIEAMEGFYNSLQKKVAPKTDNSSTTIEASITATPVVEETSSLTVDTANINTATVQTLTLGVDSDTTNITAATVQIPPTQQTYAMPSFGREAIERQQQEGEKQNIQSTQYFPPSMF